MIYRKESHFDRDGKKEERKLKAKTSNVQTFEILVGVTVLVTEGPWVF